MAASSSNTSVQRDSTKPLQILAQLQLLLARNEKLDTILRGKILSIQQEQQLPLDFSTMMTSNIAQLGLQQNAMDLVITQQLQEHGFGFSDPIQTDTSPRTESISSNISDRSPMPMGTSPHPQQSPNVGQQHVWPQQPSSTGQTQFHSPNLIWNPAEQISNNSGFEGSSDFFNQSQNLMYDTFNVEPSMSSPSFMTTGWNDNNHSTGSDTGQLPINYNVMASGSK